MFQRLQPPDHGFYTGARGFILLQQGRALVRERLVPLPQGPVFFPELIDARQQLANTLFEPRELVIELAFNGFTHAKDYRAVLFAGSMSRQGALARFRHTMHRMNTASYAEIQRVLTDERSLADAAEAHGTLAGALCAVIAYRFEDWLLEILPEGHAQPGSDFTLREVFSGTAQALAGADMEFELLLPEEEQSLDARTTALAQWCQGFLYGLGTTNLSDGATLKGELGEIVRDLTEITHVGVDESQGTEANESAYAELVEFVRVGVQLVFEELEPLREPMPKSDISFH